MDWSLTTVVGLNTSIASMQKVTKRVHMVQVTGEGHIVAYSHDFTLLAVYTLNGRFIRMISTRERLYALLVSDDSRVVLTGGERGLIVLRWLHNLSIANNGCRRGLEFVIDGSTDKGMEPFPSPIRCMTFTEKERHLIVGLESGEIRVLAQVTQPSWMQAGGLYTIDSLIVCLLLVTCFRIRSTCSASYIAA